MKKRLETVKTKQGTTVYQKTKCRRCEWRKIKKGTRKHHQKYISDGPT